MRRSIIIVAAALALASMLAACGSGGSSSGGTSATTSRGPITIWYSNNPQEVAWGKQMVASWNAAHPDHGAR